MTPSRARLELRAEIVTLAVVHAAITLALWFLPRRVVVTATNINVFRVWPDVLSVDAARILWGCAFLFAALALANLLHRRTIHAQMLAVGVVFFVDAWWFASYTLPLLVGRGSALGTIAFTPLLLWPGFVIYRVAHGAGE